MDKETKNISICRLCFDAESKLYLEINGDQLLDLYKYCIDKKFPGAGGPQMLCQTCANQIKEYNNFKIKCYKSEYYWSTIISKKKICEPNNVKIETVENVSDIESSVDAERHFESDVEVTFEENTDFVEVVPENKPTSYNDVKITNEIVAPLLEITRTKCYNKKLKKNGNSLNDPDNAVTRKVSKKKVFECPICNKKFGTNAYKKHTNICTAAIEGNNLLIMKPVAQEKTKKKTYCGICDTWLVDANEYKQHCQGHFTDGLNCKNCDYIAKDFAQLLYHAVSHIPEHSRMIFFCFLCDKMCYSRSMREFHFRKAHLNQPGGYCFECKKSYKSYKKYQSHKRIHESQAYHCDVCGQIFIDRYSMINHLKAHNSEWRYVCDHCGKGFQKMCELKSHVIHNHIGNQKIKCDHCNKVYKNELTYKTHLRNLKNMNLKCPICPKSFYSTKILEQHVGFHMNLRPFACDSCDKTFKTKSLYTVHVKAQHKIQLDFKCNVCDKAFVTSTLLKRHSSVHTGIRGHKCPHCPKSFHQKKLVEKHMLVKHPNVS